jgi:hypothetical protein
MKDVAAMRRENDLNAITPIGPDAEKITAFLAK